MSTVEVKYTLGTAWSPVELPRIINFSKLLTIKYKSSNRLGSNILNFKINGMLRVWELSLKDDDNNCRFYFIQQLSLLFMRQVGKC